MKSLLVLLVVTGSAALVKGWDCPSLKVVDHFLLEYFDGKWYHQGQFSTGEKIGYLLGFYGDCVKSSYKWYAEEGITHINTSQINKDGLKQSTNDSTAVYGDPKHHNGLISVSRPILGITVKVQMQIVIFDKDKYAVVHLCKKFLGFIHFEAVWLLTREKYPSANTWKVLRNTQKEIEDQGGPKVSQYTYERWDLCPKE